MTVRWSWNSTVWCRISTAAADVNLETMSLKESGKETKDTGRKTNRKKSHEFVQIVLDVAGGGLPLYKQMKTRNRFE